MQLAEPSAQDQTGPPATITLKDALDRARKNDAQYLAARRRHEKRARGSHPGAQLDAAVDQRLDCVSEYSGTGVLNTASDPTGGVAEGRFVTNDGVHVYRQWAVLHQDLSPNIYLMNGLHRASAAEAIAKAKDEIARRGLTVTVTKAYYALVVAQRKYATAQQSLDQAKRFFDLAQQQENAGQVSHSDVVKAEIQYRPAAAGFRRSAAGDGRMRGWISP